MGCYGDRKIACHTSFVSEILAGAATRSSEPIPRATDCAVDGCHRISVPTGVHAKLNALLEVIVMFDKREDGGNDNVTDRTARNCAVFEKFSHRITWKIDFAFARIGTHEKRFDRKTDSLQRIPAAEGNVSSLTELLSDELTAVKGAAASSLAGAGAAAAPAVPTLIVLLRDSSESVRSSAIKALAAIGKDAKPALPALRSLDRDAALKEQAQQAYNSIKAAK